MVDQHYWKEHSFFRILPEDCQNFTITENTFYEMPLTGGYGLNDAYYSEESDTWFVEIYYQGMKYWAEIFWEDWDWKACYQLEKDTFSKDIEEKIIKETKTLTISMAILGTYCVHGYWLQLQFAKDLVGAMFCLYDESKEHLHTADWVDKGVAAQRQFPLNHLFAVHLDIDEKEGRTRMETAGLSRFGLSELSDQVNLVPKVDSPPELVQEVRNHLDDIVDQASDNLYLLVTKGSFSRLVNPAMWKHEH